MLNLNLGVGKMPTNGYIGIDAHQYGFTDVLCDFPPLPYSNNEVDNIFAGHVLEHFEPDMVMVFLEDCYKVLKPGGSLTLITPDSKKATLMLLTGLFNSRQYAAVLNGDQYDRMPHHTLWSQDRLERIVTRCGFVLEPDYQWKTDSRVFDRNAGWQCGVKAYKP